MDTGQARVLMERFANTFAAYRDRLPLVPHAYSRTLLAAATGYEVVAMNWSPRCVSPIHDHGVSRCWGLVLDGILDVQNYECDSADVSAEFAALRETERLVLRTGDLEHRLAPTELHRVHNPSHTKNAYTLQLYAQPLSTYCVVDHHTHRRRLASATFDLDLTLEGEVLAKRS